MIFYEQHFKLFIKELSMYLMMSCVYIMMSCNNHRSVTQLNVRLTQEKTTYDEEIFALNEAHGRELNNLRAEYDKRMSNLQQMNTNLQFQV